MTNFLNGLPSINKDGAPSFSSGGTSKLTLSHDFQSEEKGITSDNRVTKIWSCGWDSHLEKSARFTWIAVQGNDSICLVTGDEFPIGKWEPVFWESAFREMQVHPLFGMTRAVEEYPSECAMSRPFAAVSVVLNTDKVYSETDGASSAGFNEKETLCFLMNKLINCSDFTFEETMQTAISALVCLFPVGINVNKIKACVVRKDGQIKAFPIKEIEALANEKQMKQQQLTGEDSGASFDMKFPQPCF